MEQQKNNEEYLYIDLYTLPRKVLPVLRRLWAVLLAPTVLGGGLMYWLSMRTYTPLYRSEAMFSVSINYSGDTDLSGYSYYYDKAAAQVVADTFPYLLESEFMLEMLRQQLGSEIINGAISSTSMAETNLISLTVTSPDPQSAFDIIKAVMDIYPRVSRRVVGETQLVVTREPLLPLSPFNSPNWTRNTALGAGAGFLLGAGLILLLALGRSTALSTDDVKRTVNLPCLSQVPNVKLKQRKNSTANSLLVTRQGSDSAFNESFRLLRLKLLRTLQENDRVILFTSTVPAEGKSSLAVNTALTLAKDNKKVLLVDADLRGPSIKALLNMAEPSDGLGEFLSGKLSCVEFLRYENTSLYVFSGDEAIANPSPLFQRKHLAAFIQTVRPMFDYILLDTPPCAMMADAAALSVHADKVVYVIREDFAATGQIFDGVQSLSGIGADICGFVFNRSSAIHGSGYGYGYGYGHYGYGYKKRGYGYGYGRGKTKTEQTEP